MHTLKPPVYHFLVEAAGSIIPFANKATAIKVAEWQAQFEHTIVKQGSWVSLSLGEYKQSGRSFTIFNEGSGV